MYQLNWNVPRTVHFLLLGKCWFIVLIAKPLLLNAVQLIKLICITLLIYLCFFQLCQFSISSMVRNGIQILQVEDKTMIINNTSFKIYYSPQMCVSQQHSDEEVWTTFPAVDCNCFLVTYRLLMFFLFPSCVHCTKIPLYITWSWACNCIACQSVRLEYSLRLSL